MDLKVSEKYEHFIMSSALYISFRVRPDFVTKDFLECKSNQETLQMAKSYVVSYSRDGITHLG